ncbi:flavodoxin [Campylobacter sp. faydin G-24]|uniref:Flavodoxin n=1 Tax=Campylobacter anatolicus TaxID=2829105 RepID=A0ABS5HK11_9BACT|nr:flavodoxin family protein [Campylobacter anatolicus]MBR8461249.1 flavodoxin [Campylobacter anatolicus]MBR8464603.1 flavodoxin [Campylobacter anatolicus]MBR8466459.1 flavodoxin [Campylobacter anatolicus]
MKKIVIYSSLTGNTRKVGEAIAAELGCKAFSFDDEAVSDISGYDFIAVGYYIDKGDADAHFKRYIKEHIKGKKVGLFITLGADPIEHGERSLQAGRELLAAGGNEILREFICQGAIDPAVIAQMIEMAEKMGEKAMHLITPERRATWAAAASHPDANDLINARAAFKGL